MNILYITKLSGNMWAGPNNSVPAQISAQSKTDNVLWYNITSVNKKEWRVKDYYKNLEDFPQKKISKLPLPFNKPDLVIFEGVYEFPFNKLVFEVWNSKIPYVVVPRSALTEQGQKSSFYKKKIANFLYFNRFIKKSRAVHYLTNEEYLESKDKWKKKHFIVPNGIATKRTLVVNKMSDELKGIYIGRIETYQKGLDLLIESCSQIQAELRKSKCTISLYGPDRNNSRKNLEKTIAKEGISDLITFHPGIFDDEKEKVQREADFFIMTSRFEGHPMGLVEALSYGLPCIVTEGSNMAKEIKETQSGWSGKTSTDGIKSCLISLLSEKDQLISKGQNALELSAKYSWSELAEISRKEYLKLIRVSGKNEE